MRSVRSEGVRSAASSAFHTLPVRALFGRRPVALAASTQIESHFLIAMREHAISDSVHARTTVEVRAASARSHESVAKIFFAPARISSPNAPACGGRAPNPPSAPYTQVLRKCSSILSGAAMSRIESARACSLWFSTPTPHPTKVPAQHLSRAHSLSNVRQVMMVPTTTCRTSSTSMIERDDLDVDDVETKGVLLLH